MIDTNRHIKKGAVLEALEKSLGVVTTAVNAVGMARSTFYKWMNEDKDFAQKVKDIDSITLDFAESKLHELIDEGNTAATIFYLKTRGKKRGYIEKSELDLTSGDEPVKINVNINGVEH
jgi:predicted DNA-binding transcriptional regulator AlpA